MGFQRGHDHVLTNTIQTWKDALDPYQTDKLEARHGLRPIEIEESELKKSAAKYFLMAFAVFMIWAFYAPLDAGVHVMGTVVVQGHRKAVQHPSGGVVQEIMVKEGAVVKQDDPLIRINPLGVQAELDSIELEYINAICEESRLMAEREMGDDIHWLSELEGYAAPAKVEEAKMMQQRLFESRKEELAGKIRIHKEQIDGLRNQIGELKGIIKLRRNQLELVSEDARNNAKLAQEGYVSQSRANEMERARSELLTSIASTTAEISKSQSSITSAELQIEQEKSAYLKEVDGLLKEAQQKRKSSRSKVDSLRFNLSLTDLRAPVSGTVVALKVFTVGGVIKAGEVLMEIVPQEERLIVNAKVPTNLIDKVHHGLDADLRFTAFSMVTTPVIPSKVILVGADRVLKTAEDDPTTTPPEYYLAQVETTQNGRQLLGDKEIQAGMPVDVIIKTGERSFVSYLVKPIMDRFAVAFQGD